MVVVRYVTAEVIAPPTAPQRGIRMTSIVTVMTAPTPIPTELSPGRPRPSRYADETAAAPSIDRPMMMISAGRMARG